MAKNKKPLIQIKQENNEEWYQNLPLDKHMFIEQRNKKRLDAVQSETELILDSCYISAMIEEMEMNLDDCIRIAQKANVNMRITEQILKTEGENYYMKVNNEELRKEIRTEAKAMLKENPKASTINILKALKENYDLPNKDLHIIIAEAKQELKPKEEAEKKDIESKITYDDETGEITLSVKQEPQLKIKSIEVEGKYGIYVKDENGVTADGNPIKDIETLNREKEGYLKRQYELVKSTKDKIKELEENLTKLEADKETEMRKCEEIEAVFEM